MSLRRFVLVAPLLAVLAPATALAGEVPVSDTTGLLAAIQGATPGDTIVLADGTYPLDAATCAAAGSVDAPIVVRAESPGGAIIEATGTEGFKVTGPHWHFEDLVIRGMCVDDSTCEHAFHVVGAASGFVLRRSVVEDFNAQLKVNAEQVNGVWTAPDDGLVELCEVRDNHPRATSNPVTKLNIDGGLRWIVRDNYLHDFEKAGGNGTSYGAFMKSGGADGLFERNLVVCTSTGSASGVRIGLSFGGGGTSPAFCAPDYDPNGTCDIEHTGGVMRNNVIVSCSDVGIYLNRAKDTELLFNTLVGTTGIDFRFDTTSGLAHGNLMQDAIRDRDGATHLEGPNMTDVPLATFQGYYVAPSIGDLRILGDVSGLVALAAPHADVTDDYCARARPASAGYTFGALEHSLGDCPTIPPPGPAMGSGGGGSGGEGAGGDASGSGGAGGVGSGGSSGVGGEGGSAAPASDDGGCGCRVTGAASGRSGAAPLALLALLYVARRRRRSRRARPLVPAGVALFALGGLSACSSPPAGPPCPPPPTCGTCPVCPAPGGPPAGSARVVLSATGGRKIDVLQVIRARTGVGLREAKGLIDAVEAGQSELTRAGLSGMAVTLRDDLPLAEARAFVAELGAAGATAEVLARP